MSLISQTFGVVVLHNVNLADSKTIISINNALEVSNQYLDLLVYDNSPVAMEQKSDFTYKRLNIRYVHDGSNSGLSKAYNYAAKIADSQHKKWLLLLDQDTTFTPNIFNQYELAIQNNPTLKLFVPILKLESQQIFSPCQYKFKRGFLLKNITPGVYKLNNLSPVNSGILVSLDAFIKVGGYNDKVRLDFSDFQFIERYKKLYTSFCLINAVGIQDFSNNEQDVQKLNTRYAFFCEGAKHCERKNLLDGAKYFVVALMRATTLSYRTKSVLFYKTFYRSYLLK